MNEPDINQEDVLDADSKEKLSPEEYEKQRKAAMEGLNKEIEYLEVEEKYQKLLADIEQHKTRRMTMIGQRVNYYAAQQNAAKSPEGDEIPDPNVDTATPPAEEKPKPGRKLKED